MVVLLESLDLQLFPFTAPHSCPYTWPSQYQASCGKTKKNQCGLITTASTLWWPTERQRGVSAALVFIFDALELCRPHHVLAEHCARMRERAGIVPFECSSRALRHMCSAGLGKQWWVEAREAREEGGGTRRDGGQPDRERIQIRTRTRKLYFTRIVA